MVERKVAAAARQVPSLAQPSMRAAAQQNNASLSARGHVPLGSQAEEAEAEAEEALAKKQMSKFRG